MKARSPDVKDHYDDDDDDVFYNENGATDCIQRCQALIEKTVSATQANFKSVATSISRLKSSQQSKTSVTSINRLFRFSVQAAGISRSVSSPIDGGPTPNKNHLYPVLPQSDLMTSSTGRRSLAIRPSRIAVCPVSGDVIIVDQNQSLIQVRTILTYRCGHHFLHIDLCRIQVKFTQSIQSNELKCYFNVSEVKHYCKVHVRENDTRTATKYSSSSASSFQLASALSKDNRVLIN